MSMTNVPLTKAFMRANTLWQCRQPESTPVSYCRCSLVLSLFPSLCLRHSFHRYLWDVPDTEGEPIFIHWDADIGTDQDLFIDLYGENVATGDVTYLGTSDEV